MYRIQSHALNCYTNVFDNPNLLSSPYAVQSNVPLDAFTHSMEILDGTELHFSPETFDDLVLLAREFEHNSLSMRVVLQRDFPRREGNLHELWQKLDRNPRATTIEAEF
jgi:hypothetical protein